MTVERNLTNNLKDGIIDFTAGSMGGIANVLVGQPLDTVKVKMQTFPKMYSSMFDAIKYTIKKEGAFKGLYAGTLPALAANVGENSVLFAAYGSCQKVMQTVTNTERIEDLSVLSNATAGFLAAFFSSFTLCPTELIKCKLQGALEMQKLNEAASQKNPVMHITAITLTRKILREEGIRGLFHGINSTIIREMPGYFFFFGGYEGCRTLLTKPNQSRDDIGLINTMISGAVGSIMFWTIMFPVDLVKSRIQVKNKKTKFMEEIFFITKKGGFKSLYSGLVPTLIRTIPSTAALFATYEYTKKYLHYICS